MDNVKFEKGGSEYITAKILEAVKNESRTATVCGNWEIAEAVRLPSNFTLILENAHLRMADGCFSNMFLNEHSGTDIGTTLAGTDSNISIVGRGKAILDGGKYNGLSEKTQLKDGMPPIWKNNLVLFTNVDGFHVSGISCKNQRWWALNFVYCRNGYLGNLDFCSDDTGIDANGNEYHGLKQSAYHEVLIKNSDGIDLRQGCHNVLIENITGFTEDDSIALTAAPNGLLEKTFAVEGMLPDIYNVEIKNVKTAAFCANVRLLNQGGAKLHDILVDGVYDVGPESPHLDRGAYTVRLGDKHLYGTRHATPDETYNITIKNVRGGGLFVISLVGGMKDVVLQNIEATNGAIMLQDERTN